MWLVLMNKFSTHHYMQRRSWNGPHRCPIYQLCVENLSHKLNFCSYFVVAWKLFEDFIGLRHVWEGQCMEEGLYQWCGNSSQSSTKHYSWWLSGEYGQPEICECLKVDVPSPPYHTHQLCASHSLVVLINFKQLKEIIPPRVMVVEENDKLGP